MCGPVHLLLLVNFLRLLSADQLSEQIYTYIPDQQLSYCVRRLNTTHQVGCSSGVGPVRGPIILANETSDVDRLLESPSPMGNVLIVDFPIFLNQSLMSRLCSSVNRIVALLVFAPDLKHDYSSPFSEASMCPNGYYSLHNYTTECVTEPAWNRFGSDYLSIDWPFPVVMVRDTNGEIKYHPIYCDELGGINLVLGPVNKSYDSSFAENSTLLLVTRTDSRSMFERSAFGAQGVVPTVAVLLSAALHLARQPALKYGQTKKDLLFVFIDNEAYDFTGSHLLSYYMHKFGGLATYTGHPVLWDNVFGIVELGEVALPYKSNVSLQFDYYMLTDAEIANETQEDTTAFINTFAAASEHSSNSVRLSVGTESKNLPPTASLQSLLALAGRPLPHLVLADHVGPPFHNKHFESFLDTRWPPPELPTADEVLLDLADTLADGIYRIITQSTDPIPSKIDGLRPGDFMYCFVHNLSCPLLQRFLSPQDIQFLSQLGGPVPTQSYLPVDKHELKLSHLLSVLLIGLTGQPIADETCPTEQSGPYNYVLSHLDGSLRCFRTKIDIIRTQNLVSNGQILSPGWVRSQMITPERYVRWYRSVSRTIDSVGLVLGLLISIVSAIGAYFIRPRLKSTLVEQQGTDVSNQQSVTQVAAQLDRLIQRRPDPESPVPC